MKNYQLAYAKLTYCSTVSAWKNVIVSKEKCIVPAHVFPSLPSAYPSLQTHSDDPGVLMQIWLQPPLSTTHSSMSRRNKLWSFYTKHFAIKGRQSSTSFTKKVILNNERLTCAGLSIITEEISFFTLTFVWSWFVDASLITTSIIRQTFIDIWNTKDNVTR